LEAGINPKIEGRNPKEARNSKSEAGSVLIVAEYPNNIDPKIGSSGALVTLVASFFCL
jgi:hypothetical protein